MAGVYKASLEVSLGQHDGQLTWTMPDGDGLSIIPPRNIGDKLNSHQRKDIQHW